MPVAETLDLSARLAAETDVDLAAVVVNRVLPELFTTTEEAVFDQLMAAGPKAELTGAVGPAVGKVLDGAELAVRLRRSRASHIGRLRDGLDPSTPLVFVPELFTRAQGIRATRMVAEALGDEL